MTAKSEIRKRYEKETGRMVCDNLAKYSVWLEKELLNWLTLGHTPEKWQKLRIHYDELLTKADTAAWLASEYEIANKERNEIKAKYEA